MPSVLEICPNFSEIVACHSWFARQPLKGLPMALKFKHVLRPVFAPRDADKLPEGCMRAIFIP